MVVVMGGLGSLAQDAEVPIMAAHVCKSTIYAYNPDANVSTMVHVRDFAQFAPVSIFAGKKLLTIGPFRFQDLPCSTPLVESLEASTADSLDLPRFSHSLPAEVLCISLHFLSKGAPGISPNLRKFLLTQKFRCLLSRHRRDEVCK